MTEIRATNITWHDGHVGSGVYRIGDGGLSPLIGPMVKAVYDQVLRDANIDSDGRKYAWTIPISLPVDKVQAASLKPGE